MLHLHCTIVALQPPSFSFRHERWGAVTGFDGNVMFRLVLVKTLQNFHHIAYPAPAMLVTYAFTKYKIRALVIKTVCTRVFHSLRKFED